MIGIMISIQPQWVEKILNGEKTIEIRKTMPKCELPCKVYIYCTKPKKWYHVTKHLCTSDELLYKIEDKIKMSNGFEYYGCLDNYYDILNGKVVAEFTLDDVGEFYVFDNGSVQGWNWFGLERSCLTYEQISEYIGLNKKGYAWHIENLKIYDMPKELSEFVLPNKRNCKTCFLYRDMCENVCKDNKNHLFKPPQSWCYVECDSD